ncbi:MAG: ATP synthase F1 subunit delta [Planctomycetota bacterium]|nr:ATP synthase F1 subunit delta [Planctomycetota bacterium]
MTADPVTTRYTEALFNLARSEGVLDQVERDVDRLASELQRLAVGGRVFDARLPTEARRREIEPVLTGMHRLTRSFVNLLFDKRREDVLRSLGAAFRARALAERNTVEGVVQSARPLDAAEVARLATAFGLRLGKTVLLENEIRPELIGGACVIVGSKMLDGSVQGRLDGLRKRMDDAPLPVQG